LEQVSPLQLPEDDCQREESDSPDACPENPVDDGTDPAVLQDRLGYHFRDISILQNALTHSSAASSPGLSNERLEFLGDGVLSFLVGELLFRRFPDEDEGMLTQYRAQLVSTRGLAEIAEEIGLRSFISIGESLANTPLSPRLLANSFEALVAAVYLDGGIDGVRKLVDLHFASRPLFVPERNCDSSNYKSILQQFLQSMGRDLPRYLVLADSGPEHGKTYVVAVEFAGMRFTAGYGKTKRDAEQAAAKNAYAELQRLTRDEP